MLTRAREADCLAYDPFAGDDSDEKIFSDKIVSAGKAYPIGACCICGGEIAKGERHRVQKGRIDGEFKQCRMCLRCCEAMADVRTDFGGTIELRTELGMRRAGAMGRTPEPELTEAAFFAEKQQERVTRITAIPPTAAESKRATDRATALDDGSRSRAAVERMADTLDDIHRPRVPWLVIAIVVLVAAAIGFRYVIANYGG